MKKLNDNTVDTVYGADYRGVNLAGADLSGANLTSKNKMEIVQKSKKTDITCFSCTYPENGILIGSNFADSYYTRYFGVSPDGLMTNLGRPGRVVHNLHIAEHDTSGYPQDISVKGYGEVIQITDYLVDGETIQREIVTHQIV